MIALVFGVLLFVFTVQKPARVLPAVLRLAAVAAPAALITAYITVPFLLYKAYVNVSPYLQRWKYDSFGANEILGWLLSGGLFDHGRLPVMTLLLLFGIAWAMSSRTECAWLALVLFSTWLLFYFGRPTWGKLADLLPLHDGLLFHRFSAGVDLAAILLVGLGGEWIWRQFARLRTAWSPAAASLIIVLLMLPALHERYADYSTNAQWMRRARNALRADHDAATIIAALKTLPPGRAYAGMRTNWGNTMKWGDLHFTDLLTFNRIPAVSPPYQSLSLNSDLMWHFNVADTVHYRLFDVRYLIAPSTLTMTPFFTPIRKTSRYTLYQAPSGGYAQFAQITDWKIADSQLSLFNQNRAWMLSAEPAANHFIRWSYMGKDRGPGVNPWEMSGTLNSEKVAPGRYDVIANTPRPATLVFKATYHPDWHVEIDGRERLAFMVSPSFIGVTVPAGMHVVSAIYKSNRLKDVLLILAAAALVYIFFFGRAFSVRLEALLEKYWPAPPRLAQLAPLDQKNAGR
jgi:hypothetical protein